MRNPVRCCFFIGIAIGVLLLGSESRAEPSVRIVSINGESTPTGDLYTLDQHLVIEWAATDDSGCGGVVAGELFVWIDGFLADSIDPTDPAQNEGNRFGGVFTLEPAYIPDPDMPAYNDPDKFLHFGCLHAIKLVAQMEHRDEDNNCGDLPDC